MASLEELRNERLRKLDILKQRNIDPYPARSERTHTIAEALTGFQTLAEVGTTVVLAGRVMVIRGQGAILFADIFDGSGRFQAVFKADEMENAQFELFTDTADSGDFVELTGTLFTTERGQQSIHVTSWRMLAKSILPLPDKWSGLQNEDERLRKRYLDLMQDEALRELFVRKARFWDTARHVMKEHGFLEVETPTLEFTTGGAEARPFQTHHNDFDVDLYLRISVGELWQKRLMAAGYQKTFEVGRVYRNEGTSAEHLQEFTNMEFYQAYADYRDGMAFVRELFTALARTVYSTSKFTYRDHTFDLSGDWDQLDYCSEIQRQTGIDLTTASNELIEEKLDALGITYEGTNRERLIDTLWKYCRKNITGPAFLTGHPKLMAPLSKSSVTDSNVTEKFQVILAGSEVGTGYSELNDPIEQCNRFTTQQQMLEAGDDEAMMMDESFVEMLEHGMPPTCGFGFGERLFAIFEDRPLRECQLFPLVRPKFLERSD